MQLNTSIARLRFNPPEENAILSTRTNPTAVAECKERYQLKMTGVTIAHQKQIGGSKICYVHERDDMCIVLQHVDSLIVQAINANAKSWFPGRRVEYERIEEDYRKSIEFQNSLLGKFMIYGDDGNISEINKNVDIVFELYGILFRRQNYSAIWKVVSVHKTVDVFNKYMIVDDEVEESDTDEDIVPLEVCKEMRQSVLSKLDTINSRIQAKIKECATAPLDDINTTESNDVFVESMLKNM